MVYEILLDMEKNLFKSGGSVAVRLPKFWVDQFASGGKVYISLMNNDLVISANNEPKKHAKKAHLNIPEELRVAYSTQRNKEILSGSLTKANSEEWKRYWWTMNGYNIDEKGFPWMP